MGALTRWREIAGLSLSGPVSITPLRTNLWVFISEVEFHGTSGAVPELGAWALMIAGFGAAGAALRRRRAAPA